MRFLAPPKNSGTVCPRSRDICFLLPHRKSFKIRSPLEFRFLPPHSFLVSVKPKQQPSIASRYFVFTHPSLPGFGICQNFGSLKTLQFQPPTQLNTCRVRLHFVANWISTLKCLLHQFQCRLPPQVSQVLTSLARAAIEAQCVFPPTRRKIDSSRNKAREFDRSAHCASPL